jgi:hypothetical protein
MPSASVVGITVSGCISAASRHAASASRGDARIGPARLLADLRSAARSGNGYGLDLMIAHYDSVSDSLANEREQASEAALVFLL